jgi:hypothetical protein
MTFHNITQPLASRVSHRCPCCGFKTLNGRGQYEICPVCFWEDDGQDEHDCDEVRGGPNRSLSLTAARANFKGFGAKDRGSIANVRKPSPDEI